MLTPVQCVGETRYVDEDEELFYVLRNYEILQSKGQNMSVYFLINL